MFSEKVKAMNKELDLVIAARLAKVIVE